MDYCQIVVMVVNTLVQTGWISLMVPGNQLLVYAAIYIARKYNQVLIVFWGTEKTWIYIV